jgi:putative ABC transport system permease protein
MRLGNVLREFWADLRQQRLRTTLTVLGITWGTVAVVVLLAFGVGLERQTLKRFHGLGDRIVILWGARTTVSFQGFPEGRYIRLHENDAELLTREIPDIVMISPEYSNRQTPVRYAKSTANPNITGIWPVYGTMRNIIPDSGGRFDPVGEKVFVGEVPFTVVGVMKPKTQNSSYNGRDKDRVFIPASTHVAMFGNRYVNNFVYRTADAMRTEGIEQQVYETLGRRYTFDPADEDALSVWDTVEFEKLFGYMFFGFHVFFALVGSFTLTVGGIGVANIMYIVVKERTQEIGIKRSVGARRRDILFQFFAETFLIVGIGAVFGFFCSWGVVALLSFMPMEEFIGTPTVSPLVASVTLMLLAGIAFLAGFFPARKAANLDPVECLRN